MDTNQIDALVNQFPTLGLKCLAMNICFAGFKRKLWYLPIPLLSVASSFSACAASVVAADLILHWIPKEYEKNPREYFITQPLLSGLYLTYVIALSILGTWAITQALIPLFKCTLTHKLIVQVATLDLIPFFQHLLFQLPLSQIRADDLRDFNLMV